MSETIHTTCGYCAVGCNLAVEVEGDGSYKIRGRQGYPVNNGLLCPKGMTIDEPLQAPDRAGSAYIRGADGAMAPVSTDKAIAAMVARVKEVQTQYGKDACAYYSTGQLTMEEFALLGLVGRIGMGMEGDGNTRLCMASAAVAYKKTFGFDAPPFTYEDVEESDCLIFVGSNPAVNHPIVWQRYKKSKKSEDHDLIVIDPRKTESGKAAHLYVPVRPKGDLALLYTLANLLIRRGWIAEEYIAAHVEHFEAFRAFVASYPPEQSEAFCGVATQTIEAIAEKIHRRRNVSFWWTMGVNQSHEGTMVGCAIIALALITGNIGRKGTGANSITGQCNAMGSRINSCTTSLFGGRDFANEAHRKEVAELLGFDESRIPQRPTLPISGIVDKIAQGEIKFLWVIATNPVQSFVATSQLKDCLKNLHTLVVQDLYTDTPTAQCADIFIPAAACPEKNGTFINMERRIGAVQAFLTPPEGVFADYDIFLKVARAYGCDDLTHGWQTPDAAFEQLKRLSAGQPCDFSGIPDRGFIDQSGGVQWPFPARGAKGAPEPYRRLFADGVFFTSSGKAQLVFEESAKVEPPTGDFPFIVLTGRATQVQFHTHTRTGRVKRLQKMCSAEVFVEMHPDDMIDCDLGEGQLARISSATGSMEAQVKSNPGLQPRQLFIPMHYANSNFFIAPVFDQYSKQPSFKYSLARIDKLSA